MSEHIHYSIKKLVDFRSATSGHIPWIPSKSGLTEAAYQQTWGPAPKHAKLWWQFRLDEWCHHHLPYWTHKWLCDHVEKVLQKTGEEQGSKE